MRTLEARPALECGKGDLAFRRASCRGIPNGGHITIRLRFTIRSMMMLVAITSVPLAAWLGNVLALLVPVFLTSVIFGVQEKEMMRAAVKRFWGIE